MRYSLLVPFALLGLTVGLLLGSAPREARAEPPKRVQVAKAWIRFDDGDSISIRWPKRKAPEVVRILGIDTPEVQHLDHDLPYDQAFGREAAGFLRGCLAVAEKVELVRAEGKDPFGRTLGYLFVDGKNYSVLVVRARLAVESVSHYGDNGLPAPAAAVLAAAKEAGPAPFEAPFRYRRRMRDVSKWLKQQGRYPACPPPAKDAEEK